MPLHADCDQAGRALGGPAVPVVGRGPRCAGGAGAMSYADFLIQLHRQVAQNGGLQ